MRVIMMLLLLASTAVLTACDLAPGEPCEATGDGFTRQDPCDYSCIEWEVTCADGSTAIPGVCSGRDCTANPGVCGPGYGCAPINMTDSSCLPLDVCPGGFAADSAPYGPADPLDPLDPLAPVGSDTQPIINGRLEEGFPGAVAIGASIGPFTFAACTGTLITPRIVLTAGHCGDDYPIETIVQLGRAFVGRSAEEAEHALEFSDFRLHPEYAELGTPEGGNRGRNDLSVLILAEDAPAEIEPHWVNRRELGQDDRDTEVVSVGYGADENGESGTKKSATLLVGNFDDVFILSNNASNPNNANICSGDSGGPMFWEAPDGRWHVWGVHSWGDQNCATLSGSTRPDLYLDWLMPIVNEVHGSDDVCAINGWADDGVCDAFCDPVDPDCDVADDDDSVGDDDDDDDDDDDGGSAGAGCDGGGAALLLFLPLGLRRRL